MIKTKSYDYIFYFILSLVIVVLLFTANSLSISYKEALNVFQNNSVLSYVSKISIFLFGQNDIALRIPFILSYTFSVIILYKLTENFFKYEKDRLISILIFMILPGILSASLLVNSAIIVTFFTLLYIYYYERNSKHSIILLSLFLFIDNSFAILFLAVLFYEINKGDKKIILASLVLFCLSMYIYGFDTEGKPKGYFIDTFAIYATVFSPFLFIYFIYAMYRAAIRNNRTLTWYISITALLLSLIFSFRQRVYIEDFAPYVVIFLPFMIKIFLHSYRVRLKQFRVKHNVLLFLVFFMLFVNVILTIYNKPLYLILSDENKHFAHKYHFIKEISNELKRKEINYITSDNEKLLLRLKFYDIKSGNKYFISDKKIDNYIDKIDVVYFDKNVYTIYIKENEK